jgi:predicted histone-like DNA-binding protein
LQKDTTDLQGLVEMISRYSTVNPPDVLAVLESLIRLVPQELAQGRGVQLGRLGSFKLTVSSEGQLRKKDVSPKNVKKINMHFRPGKIGEKRAGKPEVRADKRTEKIIPEHTGTRRYRFIVVS